MHKNKRGQFFLIAALVIISIIFSLGFLYNSASSSDFSSTAQDFAEEIKYESLQAIDNAVLAEKKQEISERLIGKPGAKGLLDYYAKLNPGKKIVFIFGEKKPLDAQSSFSSTLYQNGANSGNLPALYSNGKIEVTFNNQNYVFEAKQGYNVFVIIEEDVGNEKTIASA